MATSNDEAKGAVNVLGTAAAVDEKTVELTLSVFLSPYHAKNLGIAEKEYKPGDKIKLHRDDANSLILQGAAGVNPNDDAAVAKLLGVK